MTKSTLSRRTLLRHAVLTAPVALAAAAIAGQAQAKQAQSAVGYQDSPKDGNSCQGCQFYLGDGACAAVDGVVSPDGWCQLFVAKG